MGFLKAMGNPNYGLGYSNTTAYVKARRRGRTHADALRFVVQSRYLRVGNSVPPNVGEVLDDEDLGQDVLADFAKLLKAIFSAEVDPLHPHYLTAFDSMGEGFRDVAEKNRDLFPGLE